MKLKWLGSNGVENRLKKHRVNEWDCHPINRRLVDPYTARSLREVLLMLEQVKIANANSALMLLRPFHRKVRLIRTNC